MLFHSQSQLDARMATANLKSCRVMLCLHTSKVRNIRDDRGMASDPVNGPGSARRKAAVLLSTSGTAYTTMCSEILKLCHVRKAVSELGEALV